MINQKTVIQSRTVWMLALHLVAQTCKFYGLDVDLTAYSSAADDGLTMMEVAEVVTVLLAVYFRYRATHVLKVK